LVGATGGTVVVGTTELDELALRDRVDSADGLSLVEVASSSDEVSSVVVALVSVVSVGSVVAVGVGVSLSSSTAGARSSTRPTDVPDWPWVSVEPFSSSSPVTTSSPSRKTTAVAPIQRAHGRRGATVGEVPTRVVGASPAAELSGVEGAARYRSMLS